MRLGYTNVTATVALFIALGGSSYAAVTITGADVRNGSLKSGDIRDGSLSGRDAGRVDGRDVRDRSLSGADVRDGALRRADLGGTAPAGSPGPAGEPGPAGVTDVIDRRAADATLEPGKLGDVIASCAPGEVAIGGGAGLSDHELSFVAFGEPVGPAGRPPADGEPATGWRAQAFNSQFAIENATLRVHVLCARP